jgi:hypothetical protein
MKKISVCALSTFLGFVLINAGHTEMQSQLISPSTSLEPGKISARPNFSFGKIPLYFIPNKGQVDERALFYAKTPSYTLWMAKDGLVFDSARTRGKTGKRMGGGFKVPRPDGPRSDAVYERDVSRVKFLNANTSPDVIALEPAKHCVNYFIGSDPNQWRTDIPTSHAVLYRELYPNIDLKVYGVEKEVEYDWMVKLGGEVDDIRFVYQNADGTRTDREGNLIVQTRFGELTHKKPSCYQIIDGEKVSLQANFRKFDQDTYGFAVESYDRQYPLIIDPVVLVYSTYLGGTGGDGGMNIAVDATGSAYVAGQTDSTDFPALNAYDSSWNSSSDAFVSKFTPDGHGLVYSTYLGGSGWDSAYGVAVDSSGSAYVIGLTGSSNFPVFNAFDSSLDGEDAFVAKLSPSGNALTYSTFLGGSGLESGWGIAVDSVGSAYVTGETSSPNFPTLNAYDPSFNGADDIFVAKFAPGGKTLVYSTYLGGTSLDEYSHIAVDGTGSAYVAGYTYSADFPVLNAYNSIHSGVADAFVTKFTPDGQSLVYSTFLGGNGADYGRAAAVDSVHDLYVIGTTGSTDFPVSGAYDPSFNGTPDAYITKMRFLYPPTDFRLQRLVNSFIFYKEYINRLTWVPSPENIISIAKFRLYRKVKGAADSTYQWLADVSAVGTSFRYDDRTLKKSDLFSYRISSIDDSGNESGTVEVSN